jgi:hypothetical protein
VGDAVGGVEDVPLGPVDHAAAVQMIRPSVGTPASQTMVAAR